MCPACVATGAGALASLASAGGLAALVAKLFNFMGCGKIFGLK
jgi:hypothetical protein